VGHHVTRHWSPDPTALGPRRARAGGAYRAYVPDRLMGRTLHIDARVAADVSDAEQAMITLDASADRDHGPHRLEVLARLLLRAEAVGSSHIEGLVVSPRKLALAEFDAALDPSGRALEIVGNLHALADALTLATEPGPITVDALRAVHTRLLAPTRDAHLGGVVRTEQNWIGGHSPVDAEFVPPPHEHLPELLDDLCAYASSDDHPPLVQAALAHARFETLHPFADGNGRTGRALLQIILRRRGLCRRIVPPISLVLATWSRRYVDALMRTRSDALPGTEAGDAGLNAWIEVAAQAARVACAEARAYERRVHALVASWRERVEAHFGAPRSDAAIWVLLALLPAAPLITARAAVELTGRSERAIDGAVSQLVEAGVLKQVGGRIRYRLFEAVGVFDLVTDAERALASPERDTKHSPPTRPVPARPQRKRGP
jgi:Fic family protein